VVILGRAGQAVLQDRPETLHVQIIAPAAVRAERLALRLQIPLDGAIAQVEASDRFRRNYLKRFYQLRWDDPSLYDLVLNTARLEPLAAAQSIANAVSHLRTEHQASPTIYDPFAAR
jgi:cytidylate kinase